MRVVILDVINITVLLHTTGWLVLNKLFKMRCSEDIHVIFQLHMPYGNIMDTFTISTHALYQTSSKYAEVFLEMKSTDGTDTAPHNAFILRISY